MLSSIVVPSGTACAQFMKGRTSNIMMLSKNENTKTQTFRIGGDDESSMRGILLTVYQALKEKGYNPINQLVGYILSEDPTYITNHNNARSLLRKIDRDELLNVLVAYYLNV